MTGPTARRRRRLVPVVLTVGAVLAAATVGLATRGFGLDTAGADTGKTDRLPPSTATITRQTLVDTQTQSGELGYGDETAVNGRLAGIVTALPAEGTVVERGQALYWIDNTPVILLLGPLPAFRDLDIGAEGADVSQFEENLAALGFTGFTVDETYSASTGAAVRAWQKALGLTQTGVVELGRVHYAAAAVRVTATAAVGDSAGPGVAVLSATASARVVTVDLAVADQRLAQVGTAVTVTLPDGRSVPATITRVRTVIKPAEGNNAASTKIRVSIAPDSTLDGVDKSTVEVQFTASRRDDVLTVPVAALLALAEGGYGLQLVENGATRIVAVKTGLFAAGRVEVSGDGLAEGMTVGMPS